MAFSLCMGKNCKCEGSI
uniref:Uncharacterized protein n=1 Tax=Arundo donax TaxID=35708 RepID=A0A0A8XS54_ARUDO